jgi:hypothetical protein
MGLYITLTGRLKQEVLLKITTPADTSNAGAAAILEVDFERPTYLNGIHLEPFVTFPATVERIEVEGLTSDTKQVVYEGASFTLDRPATVRFTRQVVRKAYVTLRQTNYTLKEHEVEAPDALRRDTLNSIQSALPFAVRRAAPAVPVRHRGAQYEFGIEAISGEDWQPALPGVFVSGPHRFEGCPEVIRVDLDVQGTPEIYLCFRAYDASGNLKDVQLQGVQITNGQTKIFPFALSVPLEQVAHCDVYLKFIHRSSLDLIERFSIQASNV